MLDGVPVSEEAPLSVLGVEPVGDASNVEPLESDDHPIGIPPAPLNASIADRAWRGPARAARLPWV